MVAQMLAGLQLRVIPAWRVGMNAIHESRIVPHLGRHWAEEMANLLLLLDVYIEIADHHHAAFGANVFFPATELPRCHIALHDIDAVLLVEGDARDLIKANDVILADESALTVGI